MLAASAKRLRDWTISAALPLWAERGRDAQGGWYEHLHLDGRADVTAVRRHRVQARQIYVYAEADRIGWYKGREIAEQTYKFMIDKGWEVDGKAGFIHRLNADYSIASDLRDFYDHAFYLLGCSSLYRLTGEEEYLNRAEDVLGFIDYNLKAKVGWSEAVPSTLPRRQNPHMHLLEASLYLYEATNNPKHLSYARQVFDLFKTHVFDTKHHIIREFFNEDWSIIDGQEGDVVEPGHGMEWVWLLSQFEKKTGVKTGNYRQALYARALKERGYFLNDEEDVTGTIRRETRRLWVQTEVIKAHLTMTENGTAGSAEMAAAMIDGLFETYLKPDGTWRDQINACGTPIAKTIPVSTFYHIACMAFEAERVSNLQPLAKRQSS